MRINTRIYARRSGPTDKRWWTAAEDEELIARSAADDKAITGEISDTLARSKGPTGFSLCGANTRV